MRGKRAKLLKKVALNEYANLGYHQTSTTPRQIYKHLLRLYKRSPVYRLQLQEECRRVEKAWRVHLTNQEHLSDANKEASDGREMVRSVEGLDS